MWVVIAQEDSQPLPPSDFRDLHSTGTWGKKVNTPKLADRLLSSYLHPLLKSEFEKKKSTKKDIITSLALPNSFVHAL